MTLTKITNKEKVRVDWDLKLILNIDNNLSR